MPPLVAFEAEFSITIEGVMGILAAQNAVWSTPLIGAFSRHMAKLFTVTTLDSRIKLIIVACHLLLHSLE